METEVDPFLAFENEFVDIHAVFHEEASHLLSAARTENRADLLFAKVDNLLNIASETLEYTQYLDLIASVSMQCSHDHALTSLLNNSTHGEQHASHLLGTDVSHNHTADSIESKKDDKSKTKKALGKISSAVSSKKNKVVKKPTKFSWLALLIGVK